MSGRVVGFFLPDDTTVGVCCQPSSDGIPGESIRIYATDVACNYAGTTCARCQQPLCTPVEIADAREWAKQYG